MKAVQINTATSPAKKGTPFFNKEGGQTFINSSINNQPILSSRRNSFFKSSNGIVQPKLAIGQPNDKYEQEADEMADKVAKGISDHSFADGRNISPFFNKSNSLVQRKCAECEKEEERDKKIVNASGNIIQKQAIGGPALASSPAAQSSALPAAVVSQWQGHVNAHTQTGLSMAVTTIINEMTRRGEIDPSFYRVQQTTTGATACQTPNPQLIEVTSSVNGANTLQCPCVTVGSSKYANPRTTIHPDLVQFNTIGSTTPQTNAAILHSTLLHEFRHIRQQYEECNTPGTVRSSGLCTDCNNPEEMDAYLSEIESGYNNGAIMKAWIRVYVNWNYLSPAQQNVFSARKQAAEAKVNGIYPGVTWNTNFGVLNYQQWCQNLQGGAVGTCNSFIAPASASNPAQTGSRQSTPDASHSNR